MKYVEPVPITREDAADAFGSGVPRRIVTAMVSLAFYDPDWRWVQNRCLDYSHHSDGNIRRVAATCLGHIARIHGQVDVDKVVPTLERLMADPDAAGAAEDALSDLSIFLRTVGREP